MLFRSVILSLYYLSHVPLFLLSSRVLSETLYYQTHILGLKQHFPKVSVLGQKETEGRGGGQASSST